MGEAALVPYLMVGFPSLEDTRGLLYAIAEAGADLIELGVPFSDPLADGATLQRVSHRALSNGATLRRALDLAASVQGQIAAPLVLMSYYNPILRMGNREFAGEAAEAGVSGVIVPDLPVEESAPLATACRGAGLDLVGMVAPTSPEERIRAIATHASGFLYCVSLRGVTGARSSLPSGVDRLVSRVRRVTKLPAVVGFGISSEEQVREVTSFADGVVVASALMDRIERDPILGENVARRFVAGLKAACRTGASPLPPGEGSDR